ARRSSAGAPRGSAPGKPAPAAFRACLCCRPLGPRFRSVFSEAHQGGKGLLFPAHCAVTLLCYPPRFGPGEPETRRSGRETVRNMVIAAAGAATLLAVP